VALIHELARGELGRWFAARMPGTAQVAGEVSAAAAAAAARAPVVRPPRGQGIGPRHWAEVGGVFGMRMAAAVEQAPSYYGLHGLVSAGLLAPQVAHRIAVSYPSHRGRPPQWAARALDLRPTPGGWLGLGQPWPEPDGEGWADRPAAELAERTHRYHDRHAPTGTIGDAWSSPSRHPRYRTSSPRASAASPPPDGRVGPAYDRRAEPAGHRRGAGRQEHLPTCPSAWG
jgi:hypothetical protein